MTATETHAWSDEAVRLAGEDRSGRCAQFIRDLFGSFIRCEMPATVIAMFGCVHEHGGSLLLCDDHVELSSKGLCNACSEGESAHDCPMKVTTRPVVA